MSGRRFSSALTVSANHILLDVDIGKPCSNSTVPLGLGVWTIILLRVMSGSTIRVANVHLLHVVPGVPAHPRQVEVLSKRAADAANHSFDMPVHLNSPLSPHFIRRSTWACRRGPISKIAGMTIT